MDVIKGWTKDNMLIEAIITKRQQFEKYTIVDKKIVKYKIPLLRLEDEEDSIYQNVKTTRKI